MDFTDDLPQLSRLQHAEAKAESQVEPTSGLTDMSVEPEVDAEPATAAQQNARVVREEQQQQQQGKGQVQGEQCAESEAVGHTEEATEAHSASSAAVPPPPTPPPARQSSEPRSPSTESVAHDATAYGSLLLSHLDGYCASHAAIVEQYRAALLEFDAVAVSRWLVAAQRHLKQQEATKREMTDTGESIRQEIARFAERMIEWRGRR